MTKVKLHYQSFDAQTQNVKLRRDLKARRAYVKAYSKYLRKLAVQPQERVVPSNHIAGGK